MTTHLVTLSPADMANLGQLQPVVLSVSTTGSTQDWVAIWMRFGESRDKVLVYDSCGGFSPPFDLNSTVDDPEGDQTTLTFAIVPELGWVGSLSELRIIGFPEILETAFP